MGYLGGTLRKFKGDMKELRGQYELLWAPIYCPDLYVGKTLSFMVPKRDTKIQVIQGGTLRRFEVAKKFLGQIWFLFAPVNYTNFTSQKW